MYVRYYPRMCVFGDFVQIKTDYERILRTKKYPKFSDVITFTKTF